MTSCPHRFPENTTGDGTPHLAPCQHCGITAYDAMQQLDKIASAAINIMTELAEDMGYEKAQFYLTWINNAEIGRR